MKKIVMLFLATMILAGGSFASAQATTSTDNTMKSDSAAPKKAKKAKKAKVAKAKKAKKNAAASTEAPAAAPAK